MTSRCGTSPPDSIVDPAISSDGRTLAIAPTGGTAQLWDVATAKVTATLATHSGLALRVFSPDGRILATSGEFTAQQRSQLWDVATGTVIATLGEGDPVEFSPDGTLLRTASPRLGDPSTRTYLWLVPGGAPAATPLASTPMAFTPDSTALAVAEPDNRVRLRTIADSTTTRTFTGHAGPVTDLAFSPDGRTLATASEDQTVRLWSI